MNLYPFVIETTRRYLLVAGIVIVAIAGGFNSWRLYQAEREILDLRAENDALWSKTVELQRDLSTAAIVASQGRCPCDSEGAGELEPGKMGARILPNVRNLSEEALAATIEARDELKRIRKLIDDIEAGRVGIHVEGSIMKGKHDITLRRTP